MKISEFIAPYTAWILIASWGASLGYKTLPIFMVCFVCWCYYMENIK